LRQKLDNLAGALCERLRQCHDFITDALKCQVLARKGEGCGGRERQGMQ